MREPRPALRTVEKIAGVIALVAALIVLNGAWENQHTFQNVGWRVLMAAILVALAVVVETNAIGVLQERFRRPEETVVPEFLRTPDSSASALAESLNEARPAAEEAVGTAEPR